MKGPITNEDRESFALKGLDFKFNWLHLKNLIMIAKISLFFSQCSFFNGGETSGYFFTGNKFGSKFNPFFQTRGYFYEFYTCLE